MGSYNDFESYDMKKRHISLEVCLPDEARDEWPQFSVSFKARDEEGDAFSMDVREDEIHLDTNRSSYLLPFSSTLLFALMIQDVIEMCNPTANSEFPSGPYPFGKPGTKKFEKDVIRYFKSQIPLVEQDWPVTLEPFTIQQFDVRYF